MGQTKKGRPKKTQMLESVLAVIREQKGIGENKLESSFTWQAATFQSILQSALDAGLVTRNPGGGGGVLRLTELADYSPNEQDEENFMHVLDQRMSGEYGKGVRKSELRESLNWSNLKFDSVCANLIGQERILVKRGGWVVVLAEEDDQELPIDRPIAQIEECTVDLSSPPNLGRLEVEYSESDSFVWTTRLANDSDLLLAAVRQHGLATNQRIRGSLDWRKHHYWQVRTALVLEGKAVAEFGDGKFVKARSPNEQFGTNELEILTADALRFACANLDGFSVDDLVTQLGQSEEQAVCGCCNLIERKFIKPLKGGQFLLSSLISQPVTEIAGILDLLRALNGVPMIAKNMLLTKLPGWTEELFNSAVVDCAKNDLISMDLSTGIIVAKPGVQEYLDAHHEEVGGSICLSPDDFNSLRSKFLEGDVVMFVGAGASTDAGMLGWKALLKKVFSNSQESNDRRRSEIEALLSANYLSAASAIEEAVKTGDFIESIKRELSQNRCKYPSTSLLIALSAISRGVQSQGNRLVLTTNLDGLIGAALGRPASAGLPNQPSSDRVHHIHGVIDDPASWVMTRAQYNKFYHNDRAYFDSLNGLFATRTLMFVGYGMQDYEIDLILDRMEGSYNGGHPKHFFFMEASEAADRPYFISRLKKLGMRPIQFRDYRNLPFLLLKLAS